jgi:hypothetical protein
LLRKVRTGDFTNLPPHVRTVSSCWKYIESIADPQREAQLARQRDVPAAVNIAQCTAHAQLHGGRKPHWQRAQFVMRQFAKARKLKLSFSK